MSPPLILFDDDVARGWHPFVATRPAGELLFGIATLRSRAEHALELECAGHVAPPGLADYHEPWAPPVLGATDAPPGPDELAAGGVDTSEGLVFLSSRLVAEAAAVPDEPALLVADGRVVGCRVGPDDVPSADFLADPDAAGGRSAAPDLPRHEIDGRVLEHVWELMLGSADRVARDLADADHAALPTDVHHLGDGPVSVGEGVALAPGVVLDTRAGPIRLDDGVRVDPFTRLVGPAYIGPDSLLLGGHIEAVSLGPVCKVRGEVAETVVLGYSNKAHDGHLGHAYVGMWVNLGAGTTNSDLKNNYGAVRVWTPDGEVDTGSPKIGCFLGDHVKTAIGTLLNTGTVIGTGATLFPTGPGFPPRYVPPFSWGDPDTVYDLDRFLHTAATVMARRDVALTDGMRTVLRNAWRDR